MKKILLSVVLATTLALTSCQFDDSDIWNKFGEMEESIRDHEQRISALEELCKQMNTNIEALQTLVDALEKRDYITNISPIREDGEVIGYTISFGKSDTITIYHGEDGKDGANGADGKDGYTPQIGVMKDTDGIYYWTLDGEWLLDAKGNKIKAVGTDGADGKDGQDGTNGSDGKDGQNGTDGKDGITPQLKIENDYWYVSYDNGATWVQLGKATGEDGKDGQDGNDGADGSDGADGEDGKDGDSIFKSVTQDDEYVYFNLAEGTMITLPKHDKENIQFEDLQVKAICCKNWDTNNDGELSYAEAAAVTTIGTKFKGNTNIIAFTELKYFTSITEIAADAFNGCTALWKVILPENVQVIGEDAFYACTDLSYINLHDNITTIDKRAFYNCVSIKEITLSNNITTINSSAFYGCQGRLIINCNLIVSEEIPNANPHTACARFYGCKFTDISISEQVNKIDQYIFYNCTTTKLHISDLQSWCNIEFLGDNPISFTEQIYVNGTETALNELTIPNGVTRIGSGTFRGCKNLTSIIIPDSVTEIGKHSFYNCPNLEQILLGKNIATIEACAFSENKFVINKYNIICTSKMPPILNYQYAFTCYYKDIYNQSDSDSMVDTIYVPASSVDLYKSKWSMYASKIFSNPYES